ncbi:uncharacterized protein ACLA_086310 [Aspergillus clavatus NRRL 1]|uniref:Uncharacterized protein n=1 Tax=Aspergillus clavatus (strain ATCC 1007 / CBS 513.65 / DSM 816 / NCTC 3887 / NRRL 1 / QM 1276 / 107) TaxID=344612 RepID=A1CUE5_ASPCL|nr:uncharacterized protein ACLA_086310 [Aspergillus clavatus NRRL 1]EAW06932.1 conserved hypothetical protein [Aspergillus clavatus NRRL 1]
MSQPPLTIPMRTSSAHAQTSHPRMGNRSQEDLRRCEKQSKAHKILGTTQIPLQNGQSNRGGRTSFMGTPDIKSTKSSTFVPFPTANSETSSVPSQHLRVRASSPLLGHDYQSQQAEPRPRSSKKIHQFGSSSALFSYFSMKGPAVEQDLLNTGSRGRPEEEGTIPSQRHNPGQSRLNLKPIKGPSKESKRKMRPPRIDLSLLFPKPRETAAPLLSPQRMMSSPSPISATSEYASAEPKRADPSTAGKRLTKTPPSQHPAHHLNTLPETNRTNEVAPSRETKNLDYLDTSFERTVRTSEFDLAIDRYYDVKSLKSTTSAQSGPSAVQPQSRAHVRTYDLKSAEDALRKMSLAGSVGGWSNDTYLSPKTCAQPKSKRIPNSPNSGKIDFRRGSNSDKGLMSKKSSKSTLKNVDLNNSSVLCLSSSEDEIDEDRLASNHRSEKGNHGARDSVVTFGESDAEICTAAAAQATRGPALRRVDKSTSAKHRSSQALQKKSSHRRNPSQSSAGISSSATRESRSRRSSGIPTISEPDNDHIFAQLRNAPVSRKERDRRSRVMAVTRQEEHLLEAMRQRQGKITPSIFREVQYGGGHEPDRGSMLSVPSRDSFYGSDTSFLRLSPQIPPYLSRTNQGALYHDKDGAISQGAASDAEQKTINSSRLSLAYSESLPSPVTSGASPLTPTLPIHRFPSLPSPKPPPRRPPPVPQPQKRHSRRRTDSSEAIVLDGGEEPPEGEEFPAWALGWKYDGGSLTAVH